MAGHTAIGWSVVEPSELNTCHVAVQGGTVTLHLRPGPTCEILMDLVRRFDATVERLELPGPQDEWSYAKRRVRESSDIWSEHSAGTAVDLNATRHPRGTPGTFSRPQRAAIRRLLAFYGGVIAWGGNFHTTVDEMHFEVTVPPGSPLLKATLHKVRTAMEEVDVKPKIVKVKGAEPQRLWIVYPSGFVAYLEDGAVVTETARFWGIDSDPEEITERVFKQFQRVQPD